MSVFRDVTITWRGKDYVVTPSLRMLRTIEMMGISLFSVASSISGGSPAFGSLASIAGVLLRSAGANATDEEIYAEIQKALASGNAQAVVEMMGVILMAFNPVEEDGGKADAQSANQSKGRAKSKPGR
jgi:hypothetical protein